MNKNFSYQSNLFTPVLIASLLGHTALLTAGSFLFSSPEFAVVQAPASMEVVIVKQQEVKREKQEKVIVAKDPVPQPETVPQKKEVREEKKIQKPVFVPPEKGAIREAKPDYLKNPAPVYPHLARERGWEGVVMLKVLVEKNGKPSQVLVEKSSGYKILDQAALKSVRNWEFLPARLGHLSFSSWVRVPVRFVLVERG